MNSSSVLTKAVLLSHGGLTLGWGHMLRSLSMYRYMTSSGRWKSVEMLVQGDRKAEAFVKKEKLTNYFLPLDSPVEMQLSILKELEPDVLILDMLKIEDDMLELFKRYCKLIVLFNDMGYQYQYGDIIICPQYLPRYPEKVSNQTLLLGSKYFVVNNSIQKYKNKDKCITKKVENLLVLMGGCIKQEIFIHVMEVVKHLLHFNIKFILGYAHSIDITRVGNKNSHVSFINGTKEIGALMYEADIALASSGYVKYELAAIGVPSILVSIVDHQHLLGKIFAEKSRSCVYLGDILKLPYKDIVSNIIELSMNYEKRVAFSEAGKELIDSLATQRIENEILEHLKDR